MDLINILIGLISGAVGGNIAGAATPDKTLGAVGNSLTGILGGGLGSYLLQAAGLLSHAATTANSTANAAGGVDLTSILADIGGGGVGGAVLTLIVGLIKNAMDKK